MRQITVLVAGAAVTAMAVTACSVSLDADEVRSAKSFAFTGAALSIRSSMGGVRVLQGTGGRVEVERWVRGKAAGEGNATWSLRDGTLRLGADCTMVFGDCGARYHVRVPPGVRLSVQAADGVVLKGLAQDVDVVSRDDVQVTGASGRLRLRSEGSIKAEGLTSAAVRCRTLDGSIDVTFDRLPTDLDLISHDGRVTAKVPPGPYAVTATSKDGRERTTVKRETKSSRTIVARSGTGDVRVLAR
ncbi:hypothetical protein E1267_21260 [Nonomuraea longispora]|uniref:DUF4097 domain-containing protein n=1 Tax=Nonomuraea longispora TaxID=1848320 RepID=A0A4R4NC43_9ACTN|nr:DUF4097 family beta strand repeat-containing protein [Nonomuraea longispora]TDC04940.1 hypothetical protein E1267_21260 [Nonomuraea longispora]